MVNHELLKYLSKYFDGIKLGCTFDLSKHRDMTTSIQIKKVHGLKSMIVNNPSKESIVQNYVAAKKAGIEFYVRINNTMYMFGLFSVADFAEVSDVSTIVYAINN